MSPRISKAADALPIPKTMEDASSLVALIAAQQREVAAIQSGLEAALDALQRDAEAKAAAIQSDIELQTRALETWATVYRERLTMGGKRKSIQLPAGTIGWEAGRPRLLVEGGRTGAAAAVAHLEAQGRVEFLRYTAALDRKKLLEAGPDKVAGIPNVSIEPGGAETFFVKPATLPVTADVTLPKAG